MTGRLQMFRFRRTVSVAILVMAVILGLAGLTGLSSVDLVSLMEQSENALTVAQN